MATGTGVNQGKTAFLEEFLPGNKDADLTTINEAWKASGKDGTVSDSLVGNIRSRLKLSKARGVKGGAKGDPAKGTSGSSSKGTKAKSASVEQAPSKAKGADLPKGPNKTAFIREALGRDRTVDAKGIKRAWTEAGNEGSISDNLFYTTKAAMGIKGRQDSSGATEADAAKPEPSGPTEASSPDRPQATPSATPRTGSLPGGGHDRELHEIEAEIDELVFRLRGLGGYAEVQEALRAARRLLVRSHEG